MGTDEEQLQLSQREAVAFEPLVQRLAPVIHAYLARRAPHAADELLSEVWLAAFGSRHTFDSRRGTARAWLFGIARHTLLAHYRSAAKPVAPPSSELADTDWATVDARLDAAAVRPALRAALAGLPSAEREVLLLVVWEQLGPSEAAEVLGIPAGTARSRLHRARDRMRERLAGTAQVLSEQGSDHEGEPPWTSS
ncbi:RNA polymerase sigma factor [Kribbella sp. GL6]|uniref:RNA polymerase sigma factor n=1 Tax=Kribbella sp. GL6 TaxID=3419765 RepID=UPI003CFBFA98